MKALSLVFLFALTLSYANAQQDSTAAKEKKEEVKNQMSPRGDGYEMKTLLGGRDGITHGGYLGVTVMGTQINKEDGLLVGGSLAWILNHKFAFGLAGYGLTNNITVGNSLIQEDLLGFGMGYGGLLLEPIVGSKLPVHLSFPLIIGAGGAGYFDQGVQYYNIDTRSWDAVSNEGDAFYVIEPGIDVEVNLIRFMRLAVGAKYRYIGGLDLSGLGENDLNGLSAGVSLKMGWF